MENAQQHGLLWKVVIGAVVVIGAFLLFTHSQQPQTPAQKAAAAAAAKRAATPGYSESFLAGVVGQQSAVDQAGLAAKTALGQAHYSYAAVANADASAVKQTQIQGATAVQLGAIQQNIASAQNTAEEAIAKIMGTTEDNVASEQAGASEAASHAAQQNGLWSSIAGIFTGIASVFGLGSFGGSPSSLPANPSSTPFGAGSAVG